MRVLSWVVVFALVALVANASHALEQPPLRPLDAPLLAADTALPPLPPEYLTHDDQWIRFAYHPSSRERVRGLIAIAEEVRSELSRQLGSDPLASVDVRVAVGPTDLERVLPPGAPVNSPVVALAAQKTLVLRVVATRQLEDLFRHGMAHMAIDDAAGGHSLPRWLHEGYAIHFAEQAAWERGRALWWAAMRQRIIPLNELDWHLHGVVEPSSPEAAQAADVVRFLSEDRDKFGQLFSEMRHDGHFESALGTAYLTDEAALEDRWREEVARSRAFVPVLLGSTGLWVFLALFITLRRRWSKRGRDETEPGEDTPAARPPRLRIVKVASKVDDTEKEREHGKVQLPELEVPKVSHDGQWHTLH